MAFTAFVKPVSALDLPNKGDIPVGLGGGAVGRLAAPAVAGRSMLTDPGQPSGLEFSAAGAAFFNVKDFGAVGDGATDDIDAIEDALAQAATVVVGPLTMGAIVFFPGGAYLVSRTIEVPDGVHIMGTGIYGTYICKSFNGTLLRIANRVTITDINIDAAGNNYGLNTGTGIAIDATQDATHSPSFFKMQRVWVSSRDAAGLNLGHAAGGQPGDAWISQCLFFRATNGVAVAVNNWRQVAFTDCFLFTLGAATQSFFTFSASCSAVSWMGGQTGGGTSLISSSTTRVVGTNLGGALTLDASSDESIVIGTTGGAAITNSGVGNVVANNT